MKKKIILVIAAFAVCVAVIIAADPFSGKPSNPASSLTYGSSGKKSVAMRQVASGYTMPAAHKGSLEYMTYNTKDYDDDGHAMLKRAVVYLPYGYDRNKKYDIVYLLHGHTGGITTWLGAPGRPTGTKNVIDNMIEDGMMKPMIFVSLTYYDDNKDENTSNYDVDLLGPFGSELKNDVIPAAEKKYSTYAKGTDPASLIASRDHRIFCGFSMGGVTASLRIADSMNYFRYFIPLSGSLYWSKLTDDKDFNAGQYLVGGIEKQNYSKKDFFIYMAAGSKDIGRGVILDQVKSMQKQDEMFTFGLPGSKGVNCSYGIIRGQGHNGDCRSAELYNIMPVISKMIHD